LDVHDVRGNQGSRWQAGARKRRAVDFTPDFVGFTVEDRFVVGYGLDDAEAYRHLPWIGAVT